MAGRYRVAWRQRRRPSSSPAGWPPAARRQGQAPPVVDRDYMYGQLFNMGYDDVYRVSGADGDPRNFERSVQHPVHDQRVAGVLAAVEDAADRHDGDDATSRSSRRSRITTSAGSPEQRTNPNYTFDPNYKFDSDDAEVTIPGATCPGQRVLIAAHGDLTPVSPTIVGEINNPTGSTSAVDGFGAARRHLTLSNLSQRRRVRRHVGRRDDDGRVPGAAALVRRERHVSLQDLQGRAARRGRGPGEGRDLHARGLEVLREEPDPEGAAGPVRDVRR